MKNVVFSAYPPTATFMEIRHRGGLWGAIMRWSCCQRIVDLNIALHIISLPLVDSKFTTYTARCPKLDWKTVPSIKKVQALIVLDIRVFHQNMFVKNKESTTLGGSLKGSKRICDYGNVQGVLGSLKVWPVLHCRFSLSPHFAGLCLEKWGLSGNLQLKNGQTLSDPRTPY